MKGKLNALEGRMEGRMATMESTMEELKVEVRSMTLEFRQTFGRRARNRDRSSEENQASDLEDVHRCSDAKELAAMRQKGRVDEDIQELEILVLQAPGRTDHSSLDAAVDLGTSIMIGVEADVATERRPDSSSSNCAQLGLELTVLNSDCPLYDILDEEILSPREKRIMDGCTASINGFSLPYWNQDVVYGGFGGDHCMIKGGYSSVIEYQGEGITIPLNHIVTNVSYGMMQPDQSYKVKVSTASGNEFSGDIVLVIVLLGCWKAEIIQFYPPLPQWKCYSVQCLNYEALNKVILECPSVPWDDTMDYLGATAEERNSTGHCFRFWKCQENRVGKVVVDGQSWISSNQVKHALMVLRKFFGQDSIPDPVAYMDILGRPVNNYLCFARELTYQEHTNIVGGAMMSGLGESIRKIDIGINGNEYIDEVKGLEIRDKLYLFDLGGEDVILGVTWLASLGEMKVDWWQLSIKMEQDFGKELIKILEKKLEEDLSPPKPPNLNWGQFPDFNLEDKVDFEDRGQTEDRKEEGSIDRMVVGRKEGSRGRTVAEEEKGSNRMIAKEEEGTVAEEEKGVQAEKYNRRHEEVEPNGGRRGEVESNSRRRGEVESNGRRQGEVESNGRRQVQVKSNIYERRRAPNGRRRGEAGRGRVKRWKAVRNRDERLKAVRARAKRRSVEEFLVAVKMGGKYL
ncbi:hypothetical protein V8G54_004445 [Vigna mungo]|uniref:Amine oxidase domain-containing protein n=1 Tax=Vigna mungo TaxID=3915 RepID=A0AAQ3PBS2_VIGMU